jgi:hypothetical protein
MRKGCILILGQENKSATAENAKDAENIKKILSVLRALSGEIHPHLRCADA